MGFVYGGWAADARIGSFGIRGGQEATAPSLATSRPAGRDSRGGCRASPYLQVGCWWEIQTKQRFDWWPSGAWQSSTAVFRPGHDAKPLGARWRPGYNPWCVSSLSRWPPLCVLWSAPVCCVSCSVSPPARLGCRWGNTLSGCCHRCCPAPRTLEDSHPVPPRRTRSWWSFLCSPWRTCRLFPVSSTSRERVWMALSHTPLTTCDYLWCLSTGRASL